MKKHITFILFLLIAVATSAQTLNVVTDNVTYAFPASKVGEMTYKDGTTLTIGGKVFTISDINKMYVDDSEVTDNEVAVTYNSTNATVTVAGNVAQYVLPQSVVLMSASCRATQTMWMGTKSPIHFLAHQATVSFT